jgi:flagellar protein FliO/FliZ
VLSRFGIEASQAAQYVIAFVIILVLVALFGLVLRRLAGGRLTLPGQERGRVRQPRLGIVDIYDLDRQRQLILLRRDNVEHLLLIGGPNDLVVETNIVRVPGARLPTPTVTETLVERADAASERQVEARPQAETGRPSLEAQLAARLSALSTERASGRSDADEELAPVAAANAPAQGRVVEPIQPDIVAPAPPARRPAPVEPVSQAPEPPPPSRPPSLVTPEPRRPEPRPSAPEPRVAPPEPRVVRPEPRVGPELRAVPEPRPAPRPVPMPETRPTPAAPEPAPTPAADPRRADAAVLSNMARQLEEALRRPSTPAATQTQAPLPAPTPPAGVSREEPRPAPEPEQNSRQSASGLQAHSRATITASLAPTWTRRAATNPAAPAPSRPETPAGGPPEAPSAPHPAPTTAPSAPPAPAGGQPAGRSEPPTRNPAPPAPPQAAASPPPPPGPAAASHPAEDPFSVEDIEAEFARLLGRPAGHDRS